MRIYSDTSTRLLEEFALKIGVDIQVRKIEAHEEGRFFVFAMNGQPLKWPVALGFTSPQAKDAIALRRWEHFAIRGEPVTLSSQSPAAFSKRRTRDW
jgi:hypothetical protein